ncbi:MAG: 30S ribosomal protein S12 methylthiotransferase RimO [Armatimonadota bacterium]|nr:30S ribosomal protein S12 methylthiotransferase RimO [bacterium]
MAKVSLISLGCPKNLVDSEGALGEVVQAGHEITTSQSGADVIIVNTCGFIEDAREESVEAILNALEYKDSGDCKAVIVIGCLSQRFASELAAEMPEVDAFLGVGHAGKIAETINQALAGKRLVDTPKPATDWCEHAPRVQSTPPWTAYLKVSDGCDNRCAYCAIPDIRGRFRSRPEEFIIDEARQLADNGVREVVLVGQDLTQYGADLNRPNALAGLLEKLNGVDGLHWVRLLYCYPSKVTPELIDVIASCEKVAKYMDIPIQHGDDNMLRAMNRKGSVEQYLRVIDDIREKIPGIALRSTFIVGFPGETDAVFENLLRFVGRIRFDRVGAFAYSREEGTPAYSMKPRVSRKIAADRVKRLMELQQSISFEKNHALIGSRMEVLIEGITEDAAFGRSYRDAPEIDGLVYIPGGQVKLGEFSDVEITEASEYDLVGRIV